MSSCTVIPSAPCCTSSGPECIPPGTVNVHARLSDPAKTARLALLDHLISTGQPFDQRTTSLGEHDAHLAELDALHAVARNAAGQIAFAYPVSTSPTAHRVHLADGRSFHAMCAVDAMGSHFTLGQDVVIHSRCAQSGAPITVKLENGRITGLEPASVHAIHVDLTKFTNWATSC